MKNKFDITISLFKYYDEMQKLSKQEYKNLLKQINIKESIKNNNITIVLNYILINYAKDSNKALEQLKRDKIFSLSIDSKNKFIIKILDFLLKKCQIEDIKNDIIYFQSKRNLAFFSEDIYNLSKEIRKGIKNANRSFLRNLLFRVDNSFFRRNEYQDILDISIEDLSEICSTLIYLYSKIVGENIISEKTFSNTTKDIKEVDILINYQYYIKQFQDIEKFIDNFNYICIKNKNNFIVKAYDELLEKSRQHGYNHSTKQREINAIANFNHLIKLNTHSLYEYSQDLLNKYKNNIFILEKEPIERYIFNFPLQEVIEYFQQNNFYFIEEIVEIDEIIREYFDNEIEKRNEIDEVMKFKISKNITLKDLLVVKRLFTIMGLLNSKFLYSIIKEDPSKQDVLYNSWIKVFKYKELKDLLLFVLEEKKAKEFIEEFHWSLKKKGVLDLQYTPIIQSDDYYFPMNIFINSNLFRNCLFKNRIRPQDEKKEDIISINIFNTLSNNFKNVKMEIKFKKNGFEGDFDVIAYIDNVLYIFECKNTINPSDLHELRTTYKENFKHGFEQLSKCKKVILSKGYINDLNKQLKWNISSDFKIVTCLVLSTRMFNGYTNGEHHIRSDKELLNFFKYGTVKFFKNNKEKKFSLWERDNISGNDIYDFIENRVLHKIIFSNFIPIEHKLAFNKNKLIFKTFKYEEKELYSKFKELKDV